MKKKIIIITRLKKKIIWKKKKTFDRKKSSLPDLLAKRGFVSKKGFFPVTYDMTSKKLKQKWSWKKSEQKSTFLFKQ